jgi:di/tricarboxylate transporter
MSTSLILDRGRKGREMLEQSLVLITLLVSFILFIWNKWRFDVVALLALIVISTSGILTPDEAFAGFGHPAVITVAAVLVISRGLMNSGVIDIFGSMISKAGNKASLQVALLTLVVAFFSAFMNNIGALAIMMPVAIQLARKTKQDISKLLMPLAFGSLLGGMLTVIGTPPNIIIASFRREYSDVPFKMFDFAPVGLGVTIVGILFLALIGWRLIPLRKGESSPEEAFHIEDYLTEVRVGKESPLVNQPLRNLHQIVDGDLMIVGILRGKIKIPAPSPFEFLREGDILITKGNSDDIKDFISQGKVKLVPHAKIDEKELSSNEISLIEAVINQGSTMEGRTVKELNLRWRFGVNLLGVSRRGERLTSRLGEVRFQASDVLLLQGPTKSLKDVITEFACLPLPERGIRLGGSKPIVLTVSIFILAIILSTFGVVHIGTAFLAAAVAMTMLGIMTLKEAYRAIDWPIIILLGAMIPLGTALEKTGGAELLANKLILLSSGIAPEALVLIMLLTSMLLSNVINNAATAVLMAPIAIQIALSLELSIDPFLMAVAIGSSAAFMTPIAHQSNLLVMGPGGYRFSDYFRLGLPLSILVVAIAFPLLLLVFPLR